MSRSQFHSIDCLYLDMHGLIFETSIWTTGRINQVTISIILLQANSDGTSFSRSVLPGRFYARVIKKVTLWIIRTFGQGDVSLQSMTSVNRASFEQDVELICLSGLYNSGARLWTCDRYSDQSPVRRLQHSSDSTKNKSWVQQAACGSSSGSICVGFSHRQGIHVLSLAAQ